MVKRKTHEEFILEISPILKEGYEVLSKYTKSSATISVRHIACSNIWNITPNNLKRGRRCPQCSNRSSLEKEKRKVDSFTKGAVTLIGVYEAHDATTDFLCNVHKLKFKSATSSVLRGRVSCDLCKKENRSASQRKTKAQFLKDLHSKHGDNITCTGEYVNTHTKTSFLCARCETNFQSEPNSVIRISGCPHCSSSKGEDFIGKHLTAINVAFEKQKKYSDCRDYRPLPYDFFLPLENILIEYDGAQHFKPVAFFGGIDGYRDRVRKDAIKTSYAYEKGITLIRIPYTHSEEDIVKTIEAHVLSGNGVS